MNFECFEVHKFALQMLGFTFGEIEKNSFCNILSTTKIIMTYEALSRESHGQNVAMQFAFKLCLGTEMVLFIVINGDQLIRCRRMLLLFRWKFLNVFLVKKKWKMLLQKFGELFRLCFTNSKPSHGGLSFGDTTICRRTSSEA